jgi:hypothetical protein
MVRNGKRGMNEIEKKKQWNNGTTHIRQLCYKIIILSRHRCLIGNCVEKTISSLNKTYTFGN